MYHSQFYRYLEQNIWLFEVCGFPLGCHHFLSTIESFWGFFFAILTGDMKDKVNSYWLVIMCFFCFISQ